MVQWRDLCGRTSDVCGLVCTQDSKSEWRWGIGITTGVCLLWDVRCRRSLFSDYSVWTSP